MALNPFIAFMAFVAFNRWDVIIGIPARFPKQKKNCYICRAKINWGGANTTTETTTNYHIQSSTWRSLRATSRLCSFLTMPCFQEAVIESSRSYFQKNTKMGKITQMPLRARPRNLAKKTSKKHGWISRVPVPLCLCRSNSNHLSNDVIFIKMNTP